MTIRRLLIGLLLALLIVPALLWSWLLYSEAGARFVVDWLEERSAGSLQTASLDGDLSSGIRVVGLVFRSDTVVVTVRRLEAAVNVGLLPPAIRLTDARLNEVELEIGTGSGEGQEKPLDISAALESLRLPVALDVDSLDLLTVNLRIDEHTENIERVHVAGSWKDSVEAEIEIFTATDRVRADVLVGLARPHPIEANTTIDTGRSLPGESDRVGVSASVDGTIEGVAIDGLASVELAAISPLRAQFGGRANLDSVTLDRLDLSSDDLAVSGTAALQWADAIAFASRLTVARADPSALLDSWPADAPVVGDVSVDYSPGRLRIDKSELAIEGTPARLGLEADVDLARGAVSASIEWREIAWPIDAPRLQSRLGGVQLEGAPDDWTVAGDVAFQVTGIEGGRFAIEGKGDRVGIALNIVEGRVFGGGIAGTVRASWVDERPFTASLAVRDLALHRVFPEYPASLSGRVEAAGQVDPLQLSANLIEVEGEYLDLAFSATGGVDFGAGALRASQLEVVHGSNRFLVDGMLERPAGLAFELDVNHVATYLPSSTGDLSASGAFGVRDGLPWLRVDAVADRLAFGSMSVDGLRIKNLAADDDTLASLEIAADALTAAGERVVLPRLLASIARDSQRLQASADFLGARLAVTLDGALDDWSTSATWRGELTQLAMAHPQHPRVTLERPAPLVLSRESVTLDRSCVSEPGDARLCGSLAWSDDRRLDLSVQLEALPVAMVNAFADTGFRFDQHVNGQVRWRQVVGEAATGSASMAITPGRITSIDRPDLDVSTDAGALSFEIVDGALLSSTVRLPMPGTGSINGDFRLLDVADMGNSQIEGNVAVDLNDIAVLAAVFPFVDDAGGLLDADIAIGGTVTEPSIAGTIELSNGALSYLPIGLKLTELELSGGLDDDDRLVVNGRFRAGDGTAKFYTSTGSIGSVSSGLRFDIKGQNLRLIDVEDVQAIADVDLGIGFDTEMISLAGAIDVPWARIRPKNLPTNRDTESTDVVIVRGELPPVEFESEPVALNISGALDVSLGDDVVLDLDVARANVSGSTTFRWDGELIPMADGRFDVTGTAQALGQVLRISEGSVRFSNVRADNPNLRVRAERDIFGNSQIKRAGILVDGSIRRPTVEAYTVPLTTEERALTLLVTGSDFDLEQGIGALDFGTYVAPRLFVSYGIGIFDQENVISARYDLTRALGIRASSGQRESGVDITYRIER